MYDTMERIIEGVWGVLADGRSNMNRTKMGSESVRDHTECFPLQKYGLITRGTLVEGPFKLYYWFKGNCSKSGIGSAGSRKVGIRKISLSNAWTAAMGFSINVDVLVCPQLVL